MKKEKQRKQRYTKAVCYTKELYHIFSPDGLYGLSLDDSHIAFCPHFHSSGEHKIRTYKGENINKKLTENAEKLDNDIRKKAKDYGVSYDDLHIERRVNPQTSEIEENVVKDIDWEQRRYDIVKDIVTANQNIDIDKPIPAMFTVDAKVERAIFIADTIINHLK